AIYNAEKRDRRTYSDDEVAAILAREVKTRRESIEAFRKGDREDLAAKEASEIEVLAEYLPEQLSDDELGALVDEAVGATGATPPARPCCRNTTSRPRRRSRSRPSS